MRKNFIYLIASLGLCALFLTGCATVEQPIASFTMPPQAITANDLAKVNTLKIVVNSKVESTNPTKDSTCAAGILREKVAGHLYQGGYYRVMDVIWGDVNGANKAYDVANVAKSAHGYTNFVTEGNDQAAVLTIDFTASIQSKIVRKMVKKKLQTIPYRMKKAKENEAPRSEADMDNATEREVESPVDILIGNAQGTLSFSIVTADGTNVYSRHFPLETKFGGEISCPTDAEVIALLIDSAVKEFGADCSPTKVSRKLVVNEKGDEKAVLLLNANAYSDAIARLESLPAKKVTAADYENLGIAFEVLGDIPKAEANYEKAKCSSGLKRIAMLKQAKEDTKKMKTVSKDTGFKADKK